MLESWSEPKLDLNNLIVPLTESARKAIQMCVSYKLDNYDYNINLRRLM